jgi:hypothetical protein
MIITTGLIISIYCFVGFLLGMIYKKKIAIVFEENKPTLSDENEEQFIHKIVIMYILLWIPLFFIDYFAYFRHMRNK